MQVSQPLSVDRTIPVVIAITLHGILLYGLAVGLHVVPGPSGPKELFAFNVPEEIRPPPSEPPLSNENLLDSSTHADISVPLPDFEIARPDTESAPIAEVVGGPLTIEEPRTIPPHLVNSFEPPYPYQSILTQEQGVVYVRVTISPYGQVGDVSIERSSGHPRLDEAALKAVRQWKFTPAKHGEQVIAGSTVVAVRFQLR